MVSEWEFNFSSLEVSLVALFCKILITNLSVATRQGSDTEEQLTLVHLENSQHSGVAAESGHLVAAPVAVDPLEADFADIACLSADDSHIELHDRLPSYYTALAPSYSAPWIQQSSNGQVFNKLPAYITDVATMDALPPGSSGTYY